MSFSLLENQTDSKSDCLVNDGDGKRKEEDRGGGGGETDRTGSSQDKGNR